MSDAHNMSKKTVSSDAYVSTVELSDVRRSQHVQKNSVVRRLCLMFDPIMIHETAPLHHFGPREVGPELVKVNPLHRCASS